MITLLLKELDILEINQRGRRATRECRNEQKCNRSHKNKVHQGKNGKSQKGNVEKENIAIDLKIRRKVVKAKRERKKDR